MERDDPFLSVAMITYNHENFVSAAIEGVLLQQTGFSFELVISEDGSEDGTRAVCESYAIRYPDKIRLLPHDRRLGVVENLNYVFEHCSSNYIAFCEGDDYWTDPLKLQKQLDFLMEHPQAYFSLHSCSILSDGKIVGRRPKSGSGFLRMEDLLFRKTYPTMSLMFKRDDEFQREYRTLSKFFTTPDFLLILLLASKGPGYLFPDNMGVYRVHAGGVYSSLGEIKKLQIGIYNRRAALKYIPMNFRQRWICRLMILLRKVKIGLLKLRGLSGK